MKQAQRIQKSVKQGVYYCEQGQYKRVIKAFQKAVRVQPKDAVAYCGLGASYEHLERYREAIEAYEEAVNKKSRLCVGTQ